MRNQFSVINQLFQTPQKENSRTQGLYKSSRDYKSKQKHRKPIFNDTAFNSTANKKCKAIFLATKEPLQHFQFKQLISDDFCGCETTLNTCNRIVREYLNGISLTELKNCYENQPKPKQTILNLSKKSFLRQLPAEYPEIYHTHLVNLLDHYESFQMTPMRFLSLSWVHVHCKFQHITFFFYNDLKDCLKSSSFFYSQLQLALLKQNIILNQELRYYESFNIQIKSFIDEFYQSAGANLIPFTQYAKFLEIVKSKGPKAFVQIISLFLSKKRAQFHEILKYWVQNQIVSLRNYSRYLNWDLFFQQIKAMN